MKKLLLSIALLLSLNAFAQDPIYAFYSEGQILENEVNINHYVLVTSASGPDQTASGANVVWNFNDLNVVTQTATTTRGANAQDMADYPGTTSVVKTTVEGGDPTYYYLAEGEGTYLTGAETSQMTIVYSDYGLVGYFPMQYGNSYTDEVAGTFQGSSVSGTFTGTAATSVDAYGTLTVNEGFEDTKNVTRLKTHQNLTLLYMGVPAGTLEQTTYSYYNSNLWLGPVFRTITTHVVVGALGIDQTQTSIESYVQTTSVIEENALLNKVVIAPNPVQGLLHFTGNTEIENVKITDTMGRTVLSAAKANDIPVDYLPAGIYQVMVNSQNGSKTLKMVKQ